MVLSTIAFFITIIVIGVVFVTLGEEIERTRVVPVKHEVTFSEGIVTFLPIFLLLAFFFYNFVGVHGYYQNMIFFAWVAYRINKITEKEYLKIKKSYRKMQKGAMNDGFI